MRSLQSGAYKLAYRILISMAIFGPLVMEKADAETKNPAAVSTKGKKTNPKQSAKAKPTQKPSEASSPTGAQGPDARTALKEQETEAAGSSTSASKIRANRKRKRKETSDSIAKKAGSEGTGYVVAGEAQLLPANIFRFRYVLQNVFGRTGFDEKGKAYESGFTASSSTNSFVADYGITDRLSIQVNVPVVAVNYLGLDGDKFRRSAVYKNAYSGFVDGVIPSLQQAGVCSDYASCRKTIDDGLSFPVDAPFELPTGEKSVIPANTPIRDVADSLIVTAAEPSDGKTGLGDVSVGLAYTLFSNPIRVFTVGLGLRLPTGDFKDVPIAYRPPGAGFTTLQFLLRYDQRLLKPLVFSISNQTDYDVVKAERKRSSLLDPKQLNAADPKGDDPAISGAGDGVSNDTKIERKGVANSGSASLIFALGGISQHLNPILAFSSFNWKIDPATNQGSLDVSESSELYLATAGLSVSGLGLEPKIPVNFVYSHTIGVAGRNIVVAPAVDIFEFAFFLKF